jgi:CHAT domain-containing protein
LFIRLGAAAQIEAAVERWRMVAAAGITDSGGVTARAERTLRSVGSTLRTRIWDPLERGIKDARRVYVVPDGAINLVPFAALPIGDTSYLAETPTTIHYLSAERDLIEFATPAQTRGRGLLALGGPAYGSFPTHMAPGIAPARPSGRPGRSLNRQSTCGALESMLFEPLPSSRREAEDIGMLWDSLGSRTPDDPAAVVLTGAKADEGGFKRLSPGHRILHLATHGFFLGDDCRAGRKTMRGVSVRVRPTASKTPPRDEAENPLLLSGLALAGANRRFAGEANGEDGILTAEEVIALEFGGVEWAVLSACDSGLGTIVGGEGVFGLRRAFRSAGARTVIMSLWPVEDAAARTWMRALYRARLQERLSTADAMRQASLTVLASRRAARQSTHPFFWAGFVAAGDWR